MKHLQRSIQVFKAIFLVILTTMALTGLKSQVNYSNTTLSGSYPSAIGINTKALGNYSFAAGASSEATASYTTALGFYSFATYSKAIAIGSAVKSNVYKSIVIGSGSYDHGKYLENNVMESLMIGFNSKFPTLFVVQPEEQDLNYTKTGKIGIGNVTSPLAKLHLRADDGEEAAVFIQPFDWSRGNAASLALGDLFHGVTANTIDGLIFKTSSFYNFNEGYLKIGLEARAGSVLVCADDNGTARWVDPTTYSIWSINKYNEAYRMSMVGILTEDPKTELDVNGNISVNNAIIGKIGTTKWVDPDFLTLLGSEHADASKIMIPKGNNSNHQAIKIISPAQGGEIQFFAGGEINSIIRQNEFLIGKIGVPMDLKVTGKIWAHEVEVQLGDWWDEVFDEDYNLMPLLQLEKFIADNNHLPDMPTEEKVLNDGIELGEMNALLLKKVEELTLYVIEQQKRIECLENKMER